MNRFDRVSSWVIVGVFFLVVGGGLGFWWLKATVVAPRCGEIAVGQMQAAIHELSGRIPGLQFDGVDDACDEGDPVSVSWEHDDLTQLMAEARAAGCQVKEAGLTDEDEDFLACSTSGRGVVLSLDKPGPFPATGTMTMA